MGLSVKYDGGYTGKEVAKSINNVTEGMIGFYLEQIQEKPNGMYHSREIYSMLQDLKDNLRIDVI